MHPFWSILCFLLPLGAVAAGPVVWSFAAKPLPAEAVEVQMQSTCEAGWHIYALSLPDEGGPLPTVVNLLDGPGFQFTGAVKEPVPQEMEDPAFGMPVRYHTGTSTFTQLLRRTTPDAFQVQGAVEYMACNDKTCLPPTRVEFKLDIPPAQSP